MAGAVVVVLGGGGGGSGGGVVQSVGGRILVVVRDAFKLFGHGLVDLGGETAQRLLVAVGDAEVEHEHGFGRAQVSGVADVGRRRRAAAVQAS